MNERYRYGYGEDFPNRDFPFSRQGAMTDHREDEPARRDAATDERDDDEDDAEQRQADRIREAEAGTRRDEAGERDGAAASTRSDSVFEVEEEPDHPVRPAVYQPQPERPATARGAAAPATRSEERPPIALGPPSPSPAPAPATVAPAPPPPPPPAAPPPPARAPQAEPVGERTSLLASIDRDSVRSRFLDIQAGFVDEPRQAVQEAERFVDELVQQLLRALEGERTKLKAAIDDGSTEDLRLALRGYRGFVDRLLNLTM